MDYLLQRFCRTTTNKNRAQTSDGSATFTLTAFISEEVGVNKSLRTIVGTIEFDYCVVSSEKDGENIIFYAILMQETGIDRTGLIEVGGEVEDDPRNRYSPYRVRFYVPKEHTIDRKWHHASLAFDFRGISEAFYTIFAPRINEGTPKTGPGQVEICNIQAFAKHVTE